MPTITLTLTAEMLDAMVHGQSVAVTATLRAKKAKTPTLSPDESERHKRVVEMWMAVRPDDAAGRIWKAIRPVSLTNDELYIALETALDWCSGVYYTPEFFAKDASEWVRRGHLSLWDAEQERDRFRQQRGGT